MLDSGNISHIIIILHNAVKLQNSISIYVVYIYFSYSSLRGDRSIDLYRLLSGRGSSIRSHYFHRFVYNTTTNA